jgi:quercetin dioxygenase-like cupin family protein
MINLLKAFSIYFLVAAAAIAVAEEPATRYNNVLYQSSIAETDGKDVLVREAFFPVGWTAPRHYHNGNLFLYIVEGEFEVTLDGEETKIYKAGEAMQMRAGVEMDARNPSDSLNLKIAVFQVGKPDDPFVVPIE